MHLNKSFINLSLVKRLVETQFPQWANLPVKAINSMGTDNAIFRLGSKFCIRLPQTSEAAEAVTKEQTWLPQFTHLPLAIPKLIGKGKPGCGYKQDWSIYQWLEGENAATKDIAERHDIAVTIGQFIKALQSIDIIDAPHARRGLPLAAQDYATRQAINDLKEEIDVAKITEIWNQCLEAPVWQESPVWMHGDLLPGNWLIHQDKLHAIIDFGLCGVGDPACDLIPAWSVFSGNARQAFRNAIAPDEATWIRGRGWALSIALIIIPYYQNTNPALTAIARKIIREIMAEYNNY